MACASSQNRIDIEDYGKLFCQTNHLDHRHLLKTIDGKDIPWEQLKLFVKRLYFGPNKNGDHIKNKHDYTSIYRDLGRHQDHKMKPGTVSMNYAYKCILHESMIKSIESGEEMEYNRVPHIEFFTMGKKVRMYSGVLVFTVLTSGMEGFKGGNGGCQWNCYYCPNEPGMPRSYLKREPAVARADNNDFDAFKQIWDRATTLFLQGKHIDKIEIIVEGGTIASYDKNYLRNFMRDLYYAFNTFYEPNEVRRQERYTLKEEMKINESTLCKVIGLTLETRPDCINSEEIEFFREVGCTRVQLGIQHTYDPILRKVNRGCYYKHSANAIKMLKDCGFKVDAHWMPDLPGSTPEMDKEMFDQILEDHNLQVDDWKIYPCQTVDYSPLLKGYYEGISKFLEFLKERNLLNVDEVFYDNIQYNLTLDQEHMVQIDENTFEKIYTGFNNKELEFLWNEFNQLHHNKYYKPYTHDFKKVNDLKDSNLQRLVDVCMHVKRKIHPWIRINRLVRDIPNDYIRAGLYRGDLRNLIHDELKKEGNPCQCIRCREIGKLKPSDKIDVVIRCYFASDGIEYFISFEDDKGRLYGFTRLRLCYNPGHGFIPELKGAALIRELHVYGEIIPVWDKNINSTGIQHNGYGKKLVQIAEDIATQCGYHKIAIISGNGVRNYYINKINYYLDGTYVVKNLIPLTNVKAFTDYKSEAEWWSSMKKLRTKVFYGSYKVDISTVVQCLRVWEPAYLVRKTWFKKHNTNPKQINDVIIRVVVILLLFLVIKKFIEYIYMK
jgi:histone acetyltransferase (RNA polymerase elongator complex component)